MSRFRLHTKAGKKLLLSYLMAGTACAIAVGVMGYMVHSIGIARAKSRETVLIYTEEELEQYLVDTESEEYNLNGRYQLEEDLDLSGLSVSIGTNIEPFTGSFNGNGHVISGLTRPLFGVLKTARVEQLFLSEAMVVHPALYSDGQHYVDGYGALAAYAVDSTIQNCGMAGEIYTASPSEAEYQLAKASPSDAGEGRGPNFQGDLPAGEEQGGSQKEPGDTVAGPGGETVTGTDGGPGVESLESTEETGTMDEIGPGVESSKGEAGNSTATGMEGTTSEIDGTAADIESTETGGREEGAESGVGESPSGSYESPPGSQESITGGNESPSGSHESITGGNESPSGSHESITGGNESPSGSQESTSGGNESAPDSYESTAPGDESMPNGMNGNSPGGAEVNTGINTKENIPDKTSGNTEAGNGGSTTQGSGSDESIKEENTMDRVTTYRSEDTAASARSVSELNPNSSIPTETVGCQAVDRRHLMLKISTITDVDAESLLPASPSDATPSDAAAPTEAGGQPGTGEENQSEEALAEESQEYIGNPYGDIFILVTADRVTTGGLVAEAAGNTLISNCYTLITLGSELQEIETYAGGLAGILGAETRTENSYATGLADSNGVTGGLAAGNKGMIENCFSTVTIGEKGKIRGAFTAENSGTLIGCIYDRQLACVQEEPEQNQEEDNQNQALQGLDTIQMIGQNPQIPGTWYTAEQAYPQIEYFAVHEKESIAKSSRVSAIALVLPEGEMLTDVLHEEGIILPSQIDGQEILWEADGGIKINADNQLIRESITISDHEAPITQSTLESIQPDTAPQETQPESTPQTAPQETFSLTAGMSDSGNTKIFRLRSAAREAAAIATDWAEVGSWQTEEALRAADITMPDGTTRKMLAGGDGNSEENAYIINCPEALAWFAYMVNNDNDNYRKKCVRLNANIDLSGLGKDYTTITSVASNFSNCLPWIPIADNPDDKSWELSKTYDGIFDGGGYEIQNLYIIGGGFHTGFISTTRYGTVVKNVRIVSGYVRGTDRVAAIVSVLTGRDGTLLIEDCYNAARVESVKRSGGVACNTAGILGKTFYGSAVVRRCVNVGTISSYREAAGIAIGAALVEDCYNLGDVIQMGGDYGTDRFTGVGLQSITEGEYRNCFNAGNVRGGNARAVTNGTTVNCYYQTGLSGAINNGTGGTQGLSEAAMKSWALPFALNDQNMEGIWQYQEGEYPSYGKLERPENWETVGQGVLDGLVTGVTFTPESGVYKIGSAEQLAAFAATVNNGSAAINANLTLDINLTGERYGGNISSPIPWYPIGNETNVYKGTFDGTGKALGYMRVEKDGYAGLFGCAGGGAVITGVGIDSSCKVTSTGDTTGNGTAALVGAVKSDGTAVTQIKIQNCYSRAEVTGVGTGAFTAGFVGNYLGSAGGSETISNCYNAGKIAAKYGNAGSAVAGTFLHGSGGGIKNCYWDSQTSGGVTAVVTGGGATVENCGGKTTAVMKSDGASGILELLNANLGTGTWYRVDKRNDGYPIFMKSESEVTWADVGAAVMAPRSKTYSATPGTEEDPYLIWTAEDLAWFACQVNQVSGKTGLCAEVMADIDLFGGLYSGHAYDTSNPGILSKALLWIPIGDGAVSYTGTFRGNGHTVRVMRAGTAAAENQGLFGTVGNSAQITALEVADSQVSAVRYSGGIAGRINGTGVEVSDCGITGKLTGEGDYFGGIAGWIGGSGVMVTGCRNTGEIVGTGSYIGGIAGGAETTGSIMIEGCYSSAAGKTETSGTSKSHIGGILGGGSAGSGTVTVRNCYNQGTVSAGSSGSQAGGIAGSAVQNTEIISCYNTGQVTGSSACQSIAGTNTETGNILHCFYQNGCPADANAKSVTQAGLKTWGAAFALNGGNLDQGTGISWSYDAGKNDGYPYPGVNALRDAASWEEVGEAAFNGLLAGAVPALSGSIYQIGTAEQLAWFAYRVNNVSADSTLQADLTADIDMSAAESGYVSGGRLNWIPIGKTEALAYQGRFGDGNSRIYEVRNLYVNTDSIAGLFGQLKGNARVIKTGVAGCSVTGNYGSERNGACAGGIAARIADNAVISQCYNRGGSKVTAAGGTGDGRAGGIVGSMNGKSVVEDSYHLDSSVECAGNSAYSGGIAGVVSVAAGEDGKVKNCYHACGPSGSVISSGMAGGITGNFGRADTRTACYSEALLGTDTNSSSGVKKLGTTDAGRRSDVDGLNTTAAGEREGTDRVWFTSLAGEKTRGLPTLTAPEMYQMELSPAAADTGTTAPLGTGITIPNAMLRGIYLKKDNAGSDTIHLTAADTVAGNFHIYGTDNANVNLGLKAGVKDVSGLAQSLTAPTASLDSFSQLTLYTAAAYTHTEDRILLLDVSSGTSRYEIRITIPGVTSKPLKVSLPVSVNMELDPNVGTQPISYSADLELKNLNDYPIKAAITNVEQLSGKDVKLTPIPKTTAIDPFKPLAAAGIRLGITSPLAGADTGNLAGQPDAKIYYIPAGSGSTEKWMAGELGYDKMLRYRYFIEHSRVHGKADQSFGFKILYKFEIPETDNAGVVTVAPAS